MTSRLAGRVAFVTGASSGIGRACALRLAEDGARLAILSDLNTDGLAETAGLIESGGGEALAIVADVASEVAVADAVKRIEAQFGRLDIVVNCAGRAEPLVAAHLMETAEWDRTIDVDLRGPFLVSRATIPLILASTATGSIVNISSINSYMHAPGLPAYSAAKGGLDALTRQLAIQYGRHGLRVNSVNPGLIVVETVDELLQAAPEESMSYLEAYPLPRLGSPADVASVVAFLASDEAGFVTGASIRVDGGLSVQSAAAILSPRLRRAWGRPEVLVLHHDEKDPPTPV